MEIKFNEIDVQKINLQPGEVLVVKICSDDVNSNSMQGLRNGLTDIFPNNQVVVLAVEAQGNIDLTVVKESEYPKANYCSDCSCGKKAAHEEK